MIQQTINSILEAEQNAEQIAATAVETAKKLTLAAEQKVEELQQQTVRDIKHLSDSARLEAEQNADEVYEAVYNAGLEQAGILRTKARGKVDALADAVVKSFKEGYVNR